MSQHRLESFFNEIKCNKMTSFMEIHVRHVPDSVCQIEHLSAAWNLYCCRMGGCVSDLCQTNLQKVDVSIVDDPTHFE